jgi:hypothetical protein
MLDCTTESPIHKAVLLLICISHILLTLVEIVALPERCVIDVCVLFPSCHSCIINC